MNNHELEATLKAKGLNAPRVTEQQLIDTIECQYIFTGATPFKDHPQAGAVHQSLHLLTFCVLVLKNGYAVVGKSACASPENFNADIGAKLAREDALNQLWPLLGYELKTKLFEQSNNAN